MKRLTWLAGVALALALCPVPAAAAQPESPCGDQVTRVGNPDQALGGSLPVVFVHGINSNPAGTWVKRDALLNAVTSIKPVTGWTFGYSDWSTRWVTDNHIGPALAGAITCLSRASGHKVIVVGHSMGGLATQFAVAQPVPGTSQRVSDLVAEVVTVGTPYRGSKTLSQARIGMKGSVVLDLVSKMCAARTKGGEDKCVASLSLPNTDVGRALKYDSAEIAALPPWPGDLRVLPIATDIEYFLGFTLIPKLPFPGGRSTTGLRPGKTFHLGDLIVTIESQTAHSNGEQPDTRTCADVGIMAMADAVLGRDGTSCYHLTQLDRSDIQGRIRDVVEGLARNPPALPVPPQPSPCASGTIDTMNRVHPLPAGMAYLRSDCRDKYTLARANTAPPVTDDLKLIFEFRDGEWRWTGKSGTAFGCGDIPRQVWEHWGESCIDEPSTCATVVTPSGTEVLVTVLAGGVSCDLARDIVTRYYRDVRERGQGSGAHLQVDDWTCAMRTLGDQNATGIYGSCGRGTDSVQMSRP